jgi:hypothetical protein
MHISVLHTVYLLHVSATHVAIFREVRYKGYIFREVYYKGSTLCNARYAPP